MKQSLFLLFSFLIFLPAAAQEHEATIYFHDGTDVTGYAALKLDKASFYGPPQDKILFRITKDEEADLWDKETVSKIVFNDFDFPRTFEFIEMEFTNGNEICLLEVIITGEVSLYADAMEAWNSKPKNPEEGSHSLPDDKYLKVKRKAEPRFTTFGSNKKKIAAYFDECPGVVEILGTRKFNAEALADIVEYYNDLCTGENVIKTDKLKKTEKPEETEPDGE